VNAGFEFARACSRRDLTYAYAYGHLLLGQGAEPWLVRPLAAWLHGLEAVLDQRGLRGEAEAVKERLFREHRSPRAQDALFS
jgi:hypothetical protein